MDTPDGQTPRLDGEDQAIIAGMLDALKWLLSGRNSTAKTSLERAERRFMKRYMPQTPGRPEAGRQPHG